MSAVNMIRIRLSRLKSEIEELERLVENLDDQGEPKSTLADLRGIWAGKVDDLTVEAFKYKGKDVEL